jgi:hypothetical protein
MNRDERLTLAPSRNTKRAHNMSRQSAHRNLMPCGFSREAHHEAVAKIRTICGTDFAKAATAPRRKLERKR